jgi:hypothetical protein
MLQYNYGETEKIKRQHKECWKLNDDGLCMLRFILEPSG